MAKRANSSRDRILTVAEAMILERGFVGTTIEDIINEAAITKGGFFYHFTGKAELARALVDRYIELDNEIFASFNERADSLSEDPLQRALIFLNLFTEMVGGMTQVHPGCLVAAFTYEAQQFDEEIRNRMQEGLLEWREMMAARLRDIHQVHSPRVAVNIEALADMFSSSIEGGIVLARVYGTNQALIDQVQAYRTHLRLLFGDVR